MIYLGERLSEAFLAMENFRGEALAWFHSVFPSEAWSEKIKQWRPYVESSRAVGSAWFAKVFPPGTGAEIEMAVTHWFHVCKSKPYLTAAAALVVLVILYRHCGAGGPVKMMKAPGRNRRISRAVFVSNPKEYFRDLRARK